MNELLTYNVIIWNSNHKRQDKKTHKSSLL